MMVYYKIESGRVFALHNHPHAQFGVVLEGEGTFKIGELECRIRPGDGYYIPPGVFHELRTEYSDRLLHSREGRLPGRGTRFGRRVKNPLDVSVPTNHCVKSR
jgi:quercetin dioxygenase-like cupin family protein